MIVKANVNFLDIFENVNRIKGEEFEVTNERAAELKAANVIKDVKEKEVKKNGN